MIAKHYFAFRGLRVWHKDIEDSRLTVVIPRQDDVSLERTNFAQHPMVKDVLSVMGTYVPVFFNPAEVPWHQIPYLRTQHEAFFQTINTMRHNDFAGDLLVNDEIIVKRVEWLLERVIILDDWVKHWCADFEFAEEWPTRALADHLGEDFVMPWIPTSAP